MKRTLTLTIALLAILAHAETGLGRHKKVYAVPVPGKVVIDGRLDDWDLSPQIEMFVMSETKDSMGAKFSLMYDDEALYISGVMRDDTPLMNRNDPAVRGLLGWNADSCQFRISLDPEDGYPIRYSPDWGVDPGNWGDGKLAHLTLWYFTDEKRPVLSIQQGMRLAIPNPDWAPFGVVPDDKFEAVYLLDEDGRGSTFEYRIPWTTLGAKRPFKGGDLMAGTVQFNWGLPDGIGTSGGWAYDVLNHPGFPYQETTCWGKIIFSETGNIDSKLVKEGVPPERPLPLTFNYDVPEDGLVSLVLFDEKNTAVRILTAASPRQAGEARDAWDGLDASGNPLSPGEYSWKGVVFQPMTTKVRMSVHNSGQPGWATDDTSSSWGADHSAPTTVAAIPGGMLLAWEHTEMGSGMIKTDLEGKKIWGVRTGATHLTTDGERFFVVGFDAFQWIRTVRSYLVSDGRPVNFGNGNPEIQEPEGVEVIHGQDSLTGLAVGERLKAEGGKAEGVLYVAFGKSGVIGVYGSHSGDLERTIKVEGEVGALAWDAHGKRLLAVVRLKTEDRKTEGGGEWAVIAISPQSSGLQSFGLQSIASSNLDTPKGIAVDKEGNIFVSNQGELQNVSMFDAKGKFLRGIGKKGGRPSRGLYDQNGMYMPGGIAISEDGRLWVAETRDFPKRHSVWKKTEDLKTEDQKGEWGFAKEFFGGCAYFGWLWMDTADPKHVYSHNVKWEIDIDAGTWKPISTIWRATKPNEFKEVTPDGYNGHLRVMTAFNGRQYAFGIADAGAALYRAEGDLFVPFAGLIRMMRQPPYRIGESYPLMWDNPEKYPDGVYWWQDMNNDQIVQEEEIYRPDRNEYYAFTALFNWLDRSLNVWGDSGIRIAPSRIDEDGRPYYDYDTAVKAPGGIYMSDDDSQVYSFGMLRWNEDLTTWMWAYLNITPWQAALGYPMVKPGLIHGLTHPLSVAGEFTGAVAYFGPYHIWTTDGIYVTMLLRDPRDGKGMGEDVIATEAHQGQLVKLTFVDGTPVPSTGVQESRSLGVQNGDNVVDRYFLLAGANDGRITEIFGLETVQRLAGGTYVHTEAMTEKAVQARKDYDLLLARSKKLDIQRTRAALEGAPAIERIVDDVRRFSVQASYSAENLYFRYAVQTPCGLVNAEPDPKLIFKGGNTLDIQILVPETEDLKGSPVRLLVTRQDDKPLVMLYAKTIPTSFGLQSSGLQSHTFTSPTGTETFDFVGDVSGIVTVGYTETPGGFVAVVTVPQELLGLALKPGQELTLDFGYIFGNKEGNQAMTRAYWSNNGFSANVLLDIPNESRLVPEEWGRATVE